MRRWEEHAACKHEDIGLFFADAYAGDFQRARAVCNRCPVRLSCLTETMRLESGNEQNRHGMFGGLTPDERAALARRSAA